MIPILFSANETSFTTNGLGRLSDAISCKVTEQRNDEYELEMEYPMFGIHYDLIEEGKIILAKPNDDFANQPFIIYAISKPINGVITINAEHISYRLTKEVVTPFTATDIEDVMNGLVSHAIDCPFTFYTDKTTIANFKLDHPETIRKVLGGMAGSILDVYGGEYEWDKFTVKLWQNRGEDNGVTLRYGKNITDLSDDTDFSAIYTACTPYFKNGDNVKYITDNPVVKTPYYDDFPYGLTVSLDCSQLLQNDDPDYVPTDEELRNCALNYMTANNSHLAKETIKVSFVPLHQTEEYKDISQLEHVRLCDWVTVIYEKLGINVKMKVNETVYNVLLERYDNVVLGNATRTLAKTITEKIEEKINMSESTIRSSLDLMRDKFFGTHDSFKYEETDSNGNVIATYYMDTNDIATASNVMRIDSAGIYFSQDGVRGDFTSAWAINGVFNASFIQAGTMAADHIKGGTLTLGGSGNVNGTLRILNQNNEVIGTWTKDGIDIYNGAVNLKATNYADYSKLSVTSTTSVDKTSVSPGNVKLYKDSNHYIDIGRAGVQLFDSDNGSIGIGAGNMSIDSANGYVYVDANGVGTSPQHSIVTDRRGKSTSWDTWSLEELKDNIEPSEDMLEIVKSADIFSFCFKNDLKVGIDKKKYGFIIGDDYNTPEQIVSYDGQSIDTYSMCGVLWKAVQELANKVFDLENK